MFEFMLKGMFEGECTLEARLRGTLKVTRGKGIKGTLTCPGHIEVLMA